MRKPRPKGKPMHKTNQLRAGAAMIDITPPTRAAYARGGHEANKDVTYWAKLAPGCLETVVERARTLVQDLFV